MANITCAISGLRFSCTYMKGISLDHTLGYFHPIFALPEKELYLLYNKHLKGELTQSESYLTFLAFLHSSDKIDWQHPVTLDPVSSTARKLIDTCFPKLLEAIQQTDAISHPSFQQPAFKVSHTNSSLEQIPSWIAAWLSNIRGFKKGLADDRILRKMQEVENNLSYLLLSGDDLPNFAHVVADWASLTAEFPPDKEELYKKTIRSCFNTTKMFNTPLELLKEIKDYCECNIEAGSIHFHALSNVLKEGIRKNLDYLGGSSLALGYTLLEDSDIATIAKGSKANAEERLKTSAEVAVIIAKAPATKPTRLEYPDPVAYIKAALAYRIAMNKMNKQDKQDKKEKNL